MESEACEKCLLEAMERLWFHQIPNFSVKIISQDESRSNEESEDHDDGIHSERPVRSNHVSRKKRSHSSSPTSANKHKQNLGSDHDYCARKLVQKTMSLSDLELEEVKGFMDLGFIFERENLSWKIIRLIPGLKRLINTTTANDDEETMIMRPYLSEAWLMNKQSPLFNLTTDCSDSDIKDNLKCWARTVALSIQQHSSSS